MPYPLHPAVVHFPIVLATLLPLLALAAVILIHRGRSPRDAWAGVAVVAALLLVSAFASVRSGEASEEVVEDVVSEQVIHDHEEAAEALLLGSGALLAVTLLGFAGAPAGAWLRYAGVAATLLTLGLAYRVGSSGGALVYEHGAAAAFASSTAPGGGVLEDDDDDHKRRDTR